MTWSEGDIDDISAEVGNLDDVFSAMGAAQAGEKDLLIAGDFNLGPSDLEAATGREIPTSGTGSTRNGSGQRTQNLYDHLLVSDTDATTEQIGTADILDVRHNASDNQAFFHRPVTTCPLWLSSAAPGQTTIDRVPSPRVALSTVRHGARMGTK